MKAIHVAKKKIREKKCMNLFLQKFYGFFHASLEMALNVAKDFLITKTFLRVLHMSLMMVSKIQKPNEWQRELSRFWGKKRQFVENLLSSSFRFAHLTWRISDQYSQLMNAIFLKHEKY